MERAGHSVSHAQVLQSRRCSAWNMAQRATKRLPAEVYVKSQYWYIGITGIILQTLVGEKV